MKKSTSAIALALGLGLLTALSPVGVNAQAGIKIGILKCVKVAGGINLLIHSVENIECTFTGPGGSEHYWGETGIGLGIDLQWNKTKRIAYTVISATTDITVGNHSLSGKYTGVKASVAAGVSVGAQILVGVGNKHFSLQPLALEAGTGLGVAAGIGYLYLEPAR